MVEKPLVACGNALMSRIPEKYSWPWVAAVIKNRLATILAVALVVFWLGVAFYLFLLWVFVFGDSPYEQRYEEMRDFASPYGVIETILEEPENWRLSA